METKTGATKFIVRLSFQSGKTYRKGTYTCKKDGLSKYEHGEVGVKVSLRDLGDLLGSHLARRP